MTVTSELAVILSVVSSRPKHTPQTTIGSSSLFSQVHIRERVELRPQAKQDSAEARLTTQKSAGLLVAPRTGNLLIRPESVSRLGEPTPENAYLEVTITEQFAKLTHYF